MDNILIRKLIFGIDKIVMPKQDGQLAEDIVASILNSGEPCMIARLGATEIKAVLYKCLIPPFNYVLKKGAYAHMHIYSGFFPITESSLLKFKELMIEDMKECDVLGSWRPEEIFFKKQLKQSQKITLGTIGGPHDHPQTWTAALKGKKILVVHPFADTIEKQYKEKRSLLFQHEEVLPEFFSLQTIKAVQTVAGNRDGFDSWFDALDYMKKEISKKDFDVCLLGCGAYGFPLAAFVKRMGKQAVHIGGPLQLYFGIKGQRWDNSGLYNEHWVSPSEQEKPQNLKSVENGCYW